MSYHLSSSGQAGLDERGWVEDNEANLHRRLRVALQKSCPIEVCCRVREAQVLRFRWLRVYSASKLLTTAAAGAAGVCMCSALSVVFVFHVLSFLLLSLPFFV